MSNIGIAVQLYTVREAAAVDLAGALARVRETGFDCAEWAGMPEVTPEAAARAAKDAGITIIAAHTTLEALEEELDSVVAFCEALGCPDLALGSMPERYRDTPKAWAEGVRRLHVVANRVAEAGLRLSYHNHDFELARFPGEDVTKLDTLFSKPSKTLHAELDTAWLHVGGVDPSESLRKLPGRCPLLHVKDVSVLSDATLKPHFVPLGQGILDWPTIFDAAEEAAVEWYIYEQDTHEGDVFDALRTSYTFLAENA